MPSFKVAHLREQGQDMIVVPLDRNFGFKSQAEQHGFIDEMQMRSGAAGLAGKVAAVWPGGFIAPQPWHPFFRTLPLNLVQANLNKVVSW